MRAIKYILASVLLVNLGNLVAKYGLQQTSFSSSALISSYIGFFTNPFILLGLASVGISSIFWLAALSKADLSYAYPMISIGYIITAIASWIFFKENLTIIRMAGIFIICSGVFLMSRSDVKK
jgi:multidrug transporter EmrE-like cation transporter